MHDGSPGGERPSWARGGRRARHRHRYGDVLGPPRRPLAELSAEERAERKVELTGEAIKWAAISGLLLLFVFPAGVIVLCVSAWKIGRRYYRDFVEPGIRERFVQQEVEKQVSETLSEERRALEGEHARSLEELAAGVAHEIRNPVTAAKSLVQQMGEDPTAGENVEYARVAMEELARVERSVSHLLRFARDEEMQVAELRMADVVGSALETFRDRAEREGIALEREIDSEGQLQGDAEKLRRVAINLVGNALDALSQAGLPDPRVRVELGENLARTEVWLRVSDNGPGIEPEIRARLFSPFYTSKDAGTGLGLAITKKLVEAHGGSIEVESAPGDGARFLVTLPKQRAAAGSGS